LKDGEAITGAILDTTRIISENGVDTVVVIQPDPMTIHITKWSRDTSREFTEKIAGNNPE